MWFLTTLRRRQQTIQSLVRKGYRDAYVEQHIKRGIATQIRAMRDARKWTQSELARRLDISQPNVARLEDEDYGQYSLQTLKRLASAFDVALVVRFVPFSQLVDYTTRISPADLVPASFENDTELHLTPLAASGTTVGRVEPASTTGVTHAGFASSQLPLAFSDSPVVAIRRVPATTTKVEEAANDYQIAAGG